MSTIVLNKFLEKKFLSLIRQGDYAHAGEEEAIDLCMQKIQPSPERKILDIGCGLGKTAATIQEKGYGQVTGVDIDKESIAYAKKHYPQCNFYVSDAQSLTVKCEHDFDLAVLFNSYYSFMDQPAALREIYKILKPDGSLLIFDYTNLCETDTLNPLYSPPEHTEPFCAIKIDTIKQQLQKIGFGTVNVVCLDHYYMRWYVNLLIKLLQRKNLITTEFGEDRFKIAYARYTEMLQAILDKKLGGSVIYAAKQV